MRFFSILKCWVTLIVTPKVRLFRLCAYKYNRFKINDTDANLTEIANTMAAENNMKVVLASSIVLFCSV